MSSNGETVPEGTKEVTSQAGKGKGKAIEQPQAMEEDEESEEESGPEEVYSPCACYLPTLLTACYSNQSLKKKVRYPLEFKYSPLRSLQCKTMKAIFTSPNYPCALKDSILT